MRMGLSFLVRALEILGGNNQFRRMSRKLKLHRLAVNCQISRSHVARC